mmetsp:Transcript_7250/g.12188  ORF Transcript_7250/g.12188 Transcript_7250/m.12188 type:complete len:90 (-) Transcript_7250:1583-1852(-)
MSIYTNTDEHQRLAALFSRCSGDLNSIAVALLKDEEWAEYRVDEQQLRQKFPRDATMFACHMISGDFGRRDPRDEYAVVVSDESHAPQK